MGQSGSSGRGARYEQVGVVVTGLHAPVDIYIGITPSGLAPRGVDVPNFNRNIAWVSTLDKREVGDSATDGDIADTIRGRDFA